MTAHFKLFNFSGSYDDLRLPEFTQKVQQFLDAHNIVSVDKTATQTACSGLLMAGVTTLISYVISYEDKYEEQQP